MRKVKVRDFDEQDLQRIKQINIIKARLVFQSRPKGKPSRGHN